MHPTPLVSGCFGRRKTLTSFCLVMASVLAVPQAAWAEGAIDPGAAWEAAPQTQEEPEPAAEQSPAGAPSAEDDSLSQSPAPGAVQSASAPTTAKPKVAVVILHKDLGKPFDMSVINRIMEPLVPHADFVALPVVRRAVGRTGLGAQMIHLPKNLQRIGQSVGADYTIVVEAVGRGRNAGVFAALVDVRTGETTVARRVAMPTRAITNSQAIVLVDLLVGGLAAGQPAGSFPAETPAAAPSPVALGHDDAPAAPQAEPTKAAEMLDPNAQIGPRVASIMVGPSLSQRVAHLKDTQQSGTTPPQYAGSGNNTNPYFPGFTLDGEVYSGLVTKHRRVWFDQFGVGLHLMLAPVLSYTEGSTTKISSLVSEIDVHAMYRFLAMPHRPNTPSVTLQVGINRFAFPLKQVQFPGAAYMAPHIGLDIRVPLHRALLVRAFGGLRPGVSPSDDTGKLLGKSSSGFGFVAGGGLLASWRLLEVGFRAQFERLALSYKGDTALTGTPVLSGSSTPVQFANIKLTDQLMQFVITVGVAY